MIRLLIYDLDGTLIDSRLDIADAVNRTLQEMGFGEISIDLVSSFVGSGVSHLMRQALQASDRVSDAPPSPKSLEKSIKLFRRRYGEHLLEKTQLYPSVRKVLEFFKDRKQAVITNKPEDFSLQILRGLGVESYFFRVIGGDGGFPKKPDPTAVKELLNSAGVSAKEAVLIGDSAIDIETGRNAGMATFAVTCGFGKLHEIEKAKPDFIIRDLAELAGHAFLG